MTRINKPLVTLRASLVNVTFVVVAFAAGAVPLIASAFDLAVTKGGSGSGFVTSNPAGIDCGATCTGDYGNGASVTLTASPDAGSQFTGWLGACTGAGACQVTVTANTSVSATFAPNAIGSPTLDIDGNSQLDALTDGLLAIRFLFGLTGQSLINGAVGAGATRSTAAAIGGYLGDIRPVLDVDGNGQADALTDGLLVIRYLFGLRGASLISGAVGLGAARSTAAAIETQVEGLLAPPSSPAELSVSLTGTGSGTVTSTPTGIVCGAACTQTFSSGAMVNLAAIAGGGSTFTGWSGACAGTGACVIAMDADKSVSANFTADAVVPPPADPTVATDIAASTAFLYTGPNPLQTGVAPNTLQSDRIAILRGIVRTRDGAALTGVTMTILGHPEFGQTQTRADGVFDLALNGGGALIVNYQKTGFLPVQRIVSPRWRSYEWLPEVVMIPLDTAVTAIDLSAAGMQTARGSPVSDADGARRATMLFPQGTTATMTLPNGTTQPITAINVRATEFTVGATGPKAMPAALPPSSGYTYAVELSIDEALAAGATTVTFSQPLPVYLENFLGFPVGGAVPAGYYDRQQGRWVASANGRVIKILAINANLADLDLTGTGIAANDAALAALGVTIDERMRLAQLYTAGQTLWRVPVAHFTPWDCNWPYGPPPDSGPPPAGGDGGGGGGGDDGKPKQPKGGPDDECGSIIGCDTQSLGESIAVAGTPWRLHYRSDRSLGRRDAYTLDIVVSDSKPVPASLAAMRVDVNIAGRLYQKTFAPAPNVRHAVVWDGKDAYGRTPRGAETAYIRVSYDYTPQYYAARADFENSFARAEASGPAVGIVRGASLISLTQSYTEPVGVDARAQGLGNWTLSIHHAYAPNSGIVYYGNGTRSRPETLGLIIDTFAGNGLSGHSGDGGPATAASFANNEGVAVGPDGSVYIADNPARRIRKVAPDGTITTVAGNGTAGFSGDGGPATAAQLWGPRTVAVGPDGSLYLPDFGNDRIRRVGLDGKIQTIAGTGVRGFSGDGGPATAAKLSAPYSVAVGADGSYYFWDSGNLRVRRVGPDGIITTVAGNGIPGSGGDGGPATSASLYSTIDPVTLAPDGSLYIADSGNTRIRRVGTDGIITRVAGSTEGFVGDGGPALQAKFNHPERVVVAADGTLFIADALNYRIRKIAPNGVISTFSGNGTGVSAGDNGPAAAGQFAFPTNLALAPDGTLYVSDTVAKRIRRIRSVSPRFTAADIGIASEDGSEIFLFNGNGRHEQTLDALTGAVRYQFGYDSDGYLTTITDASNNVTTIQRSGATPTAIVAPTGQTTTLSLDANGHLHTAVDPASRTHTMTYTPEGLLTSFADPGGNVHHFEYDAMGRLTRNESPTGEVKTLARTDLASNHYKVAVTSGPGLVTTYAVENLPTGDVRRVRTSPSGAQTETLLRPNGSRRVTYPDGSIEEIVTGPDPRFRMQAPFAKSQTLTTPGGKTRVITRTQAATLTDPLDILSLATLTRTLTIDGRTSTTSYDNATRTFTFTSPGGRTGTVTLDARGLVTHSQLAGLDPVDFTFTPNGRVSTITEGTGGSARTTTLTYGSGPNAAYLAQIDDALSRQTTFAYDAAGRTTQEVLPGARTIAYGYDNVGNVTSLTPPGKSAHTFTHTSEGQLASYTAPGVAGGGTPSAYTYDTLGRLTQLHQPDGQTVTLNYDAASRPNKLTFGGRIIDVAYKGAGENVQTIAGPAGQQLDFASDGPMLVGQTWSGPIAGSVTRTLDNGLRSLTRSVNGAAISLTYDADGLVTAAGALTLTRHPSHGLVSATTLGSVTDTRTYTGFGALDHYTARFSGTPFWDVQLTRDALGRITTKSESLAGPADNYTYSYDAAGRLAGILKNGVSTHAYTYDANGNRLTANAVVAAYDAQDRLTQSGTTTYAYTPNGELQSKTAPGGTTAYTYDAIGNLLHVSLPGAVNIDYLVDGLSRRTGRKVGGTLTHGWLYDEQSRIVAELDGAGAVVSRFVYASRTNVPEYMVKGGSAYRLVSDHLGSVRFVVKSDDGTIAQALDYDPFGAVVVDTAPGFQPFAFAGGLYDQDTKFVRFGARDYDPAAGRWTTKDPILFAGGDTNLYAYAANDPLNRRDSNGLDGPSEGGVCAGPPVDLNLGKPIYFDKSPQPAAPPLCPTCSVPAAAGGSSGSGAGGGPSAPLLTLGPFRFTPSLNFPGLADLRDWNPKSLFDKYSLKLDAPLNPDFTLPDKPKKPGAPDPNGPNPRPQAPVCKREPEQDPGYTSCQ